MDDKEIESVAIHASLISHKGKIFENSSLFGDVCKTDRNYTEN